MSSDNKEYKFVQQLSERYWHLWNVQSLLFRICDNINAKDSTETTQTMIRIKGRMEEQVEVLRLFNEAYGTKWNIFDLLLGEEVGLKW